MRGRFVELSLCLVLGASASYPRVSLAQPAASDATRQEAHERFDRGLKLFNQGDNSGALAEFTRAYELVPHPLVLFNIGLVHSSMHHSVDAVTTFDRLLASPGQLGARELEVARARREEQAALIGELAISVDVAGADVEVDNLPVGKSPLPGPVRVSSGEHWVSAIAPGRYPERRRVVVAGKSKADVSLVLRELDRTLARLTVKANVPAADVLVDGVPVGKTPLPASLAFAPGAHTIEVRRPGYVAATQSVTLGEGVTGEVSLDLAVDQAALRSQGGSLALSISEPDAVVFVDTVPRGTYAAPLQLPPGKHSIRVERAGFFPFQREIEIPERGRLEVPIDLQPTPEKRASYRSAATTQRTLGFIGLATGAALAAGGTGFLIYNQGQKNDAKDAFDTADLNTPGGECYPGTDGRTAVSTPTCVEELRIRLDNLEEARGHDKFGWIGVGVGAAVLGTGAILLLTANDPDRYEPKSDSNVFARGRLLPVAYVGGAFTGLGVTGAF
ncbi:MAG TPA: PEGA domain-containing protein [Polyangiaceae bacterium]|nr:PEGA domain-containing protein [Polyangiaceae bacterium]